MTLPAKPLLLCAALLVPGAAAAQVLGADAGFSYRLVDVTYPEGNTLSASQLSLDVGLRAASGGGYGYILKWDLEGAYRRLRSELNDQRDESSDTYGFNAALRLFDPRAHPFSLGLTGSRSETEYARGAGNALVSKSTYLTMGGDTQLRAIRGLPLTLSYSRLEGEESIPGYADHEHERTTLSASTAQGTGPAQYRASYTKVESTGSWTSDQYDEEKVVYSATGDPGGEFKVFLAGSYGRREPTISTAGAWGSESNGFRAVLGAPKRFGERFTLTYRYANATTYAPSSPSAGTIAQGIIFERDVRLTGERLALRPLLDLSMSERRLGASGTRATGETAGAQLWYRTADTGPFWEVRGGPLVSLLQPESGPNRVGHGATAGARAALPWLGYRFDVRYDADYWNDLYGTEGWSLRQQFTGGADGQVAGLRFRANASAGAFRSWAPLLGDAASRRLQLDGTLFARSRDATLSLSHQSGTVGVQDEFVGDGLLVPTAFDTSATSVRVTLAERLTHWLSLRIQGDMNRSVAPGQPSLYQYAATAALSIPYGAFTFTAEDTLLVSETPTGWLRTNTFLVRAYRTFGGRY